MTAYLRPFRTPAAQDRHAFTGRNGRQGGVHNTQQPGVIPFKGEGKRGDFHAREVSQLHVVQVISVDQVIGADEIAEVDVCLAEGHCADRGQGGRVQLQDGLGVKRLDFLRL